VGQTPMHIFIIVKKQCPKHSASSKVVSLLNFESSLNDYVLLIVFSPEASFKMLVGFISSFKMLVGFLSSFA
jgi:hypothetical protein